MIVKTFEIKKNKLDNQKFFLIYGENEGLKKEIINILKKNLSGSINDFDEIQIIDNKELFYEKVYNKSLFEKEKILIINRCSEKIYGIIETLLEKKNFRY